MSYAKLRGRIREVYGTETEFAKAINKDRANLSLKLNGKVEWTRREIEIVCKALGIELDEVSEYFFKN